MINGYKPTRVKTTNIISNIISCKSTLRGKKYSGKKIEDWMRDQFIEPCESEQASPLVVTYKKCGSAHVCIDYRKTNDRYPLIEDQLDNRYG